MMWLAGAALCLLLAGAYGFLLLLLRYDLTPKAALYRIVSRLGMDWEKLKPGAKDAPYRQIRPSKQGLNRPVLLNLETSDGSGQACHPDVAYIAEGFGASKWTYWMACTPYPHGDAYYENPEIFASFDGINWTVPLGLRNPLVPSLETLGDHNSDPDILFHQKELWLFYRETLRSKTPNENRIYLMRSVDGVRWSARVEVLIENDGRELLSPAVIHDGIRFVMWTIEIGVGKLMLVRRCSHNGVDWCEPVNGNISGLEPGRYPWHIDVIQDEGSLSAVLVSCLGMGGVGPRIHYASSQDGGLNWLVEDFLLEQSYQFESGYQYRASLCRRPEQARQYDLWYTAASKKHVFSIAHMKMVRDGNKLLPLGAS
ncbi:MAG TPA: hypothetical protein VFN26_13610 [Candidatus Acidoferrum sp.]|nr:hypothetical protein [Candidatus Acidoferrum sp.]